MDSRPIRIFITPELISEREPEMVARVLDAGWDAVHLRHPESGPEEMRRLLEAIPRRYHNRLRLHDHFQLAEHFDLGGLHLNGRCPEAPEGYRGKLSRSCHSIAEVREAEECDYVTLSPIFDSISKPGYRSAFSREELLALNDIARPSVIALGGITPERLEQLKGLGFAGYAAKGAIESFLNKQ